MATVVGYSVLTQRRAKHVVAATHWRCWFCFEGNAGKQPAAQCRRRCETGPPTSSRFWGPVGKMQTVHKVKNVDIGVGSFAVQHDLTSAGAGLASHGLAPRARVRQVEMQHVIGDED